MECTHPVLYNYPDGLRCHICGALVDEQSANDKQAGQEEKPAEAPKKAAKRKAKTQAD